MKKVLIFLLGFTLTLYALDKVWISGKVSDPIGNPLIGVRIKVKGTVLSTYTSKNGEFSLSVKPGTYQLEFSKEGYRSKKEIIRVQNSIKIEVKLKLKPITIAPLEDIVVTASKSDRTGFELPYSTAIITDKDITREPSSTLTDEIMKLPGIYFTGNGFYRSPSVRGMARKRALMLFDGVRLYKEMNVGPDLSFINPFDIDTVEVMKGPFSTLYGSEAIAGVIEVKTKEPFFYDSRFRTSGTIAGSYFSINSCFNTYANFMGGNEKVSFALSSGWRKAEDYKTATGERVNAGFDEKFFHGNFNFVLGKNNKFSFSYFNSKGKDIGKPTFSPSLKAIHPEDGQSIISFRYSWTNISPVLNSLNFFLYRHKIHTTVKFNKKIPEEQEEVENFRDMGRDEYNASLEGTFDFSEKLSSVVGMEGYFRENIYLKGEKSLYKLPEDTLLNKKKEIYVENAHQRDYGMFMQNTLALSQRLVINFGLRYDYFKDYARRGNGEKGKGKQGALSGNLGLTSSISDSVNLYANFGSGFRIPSVKEKYYIGSTPGGMNIGSPELLPERSYNYDFGLKFRKTKKCLRLYGEASLFYNDIKNMIAIKWNQPTGNRIGIFKNLGKAKIYGFELFVAGQFKKGFQTILSLSKIYGKDVENNELLMDIPPLQANFEIIKNFAKGKFWVESYIRYSAKEKEVAKGDLPADAFTVIDLYGGAKLFKGIKLVISITNLFNKEYREPSSFPNVYAPGRGANLSFIYRF